MKKERTYGYYHTGTDSFDNPEIKTFLPACNPTRFAWGPFKTWEAARRDFRRMVVSDIQNLQDLYDNILCIGEPATKKYTNKKGKVK